MLSRVVTSLTISLSLACGTTGAGEKPMPVVEAPGADSEAPKAAVSEKDIEEKSKVASKEAVAAQKECSRRLGAPVEITNSLGTKLRLIPAGEFLMGSPASDSSALGIEKPQHKVQLTKPFYLGVYEVRQAEYAKVMGENPSAFAVGGRMAASVSGKHTSNHPVEDVSWEDAVEFCGKLSDRPQEKEAGLVYRLPTEAEWEYACRAGTTTKWYCGDNEEELGQVAWYGEWGGTTHSVVQRTPNAWGLHDMHGNVFEWCQDWLAAYPSDEASDPTGPTDAKLRVGRSGGWFFDARWCRAAYRVGNVPRHRACYLGFRVAAVPPQLVRT